MDSLFTLPSFLFIVTTICFLVLTFDLFTGSQNGRLKGMLLRFVVLSLCWLALQALFAIAEVYSTNLKYLPPKIALYGVLPALLMILLLFLSRRGRTFLNEFPLKTLTYIHIIRIPVEITLYLLFLDKQIPELMTFAGLNFDILAGISAPFIYYIAFRNNTVNKRLLVVWNFICLALLLNIVIIALLSAPTPLQLLAFDQPNTAILFFPYVWLPTFIVPLVLFSHLASLRLLLKK